MNDSTPKWLKKIFSVGTISLIVAIIGVWISYKTLLVDTGGELSINNTEMAQKAFKANYTIALNEKSLTAVNDFMPQFVNNSNYVLKDFFLRYNFKTEGCNLIATGFYDVTESRDGAVFTLRDERLAPAVSVQEPIASVENYEQSFRISYEVISSFSGGTAPFKESHSLRFIVVERGTMSSRQWYDKVAETAGSSNVIAMYSTSDWLDLTNPLPKKENVREQNNESTSVTETKKEVTQQSEITGHKSESNPTGTVTTTTVTTKSQGWNWLTILIIVVLGLVLTAGIIGCEELIETVGTAMEWRSFSWDRFLDTFYDNVWSGASRSSGYIKWWVRFVFVTTCFVSLLFSILLIIGLYALIRGIFF